MDSHLHDLLKASRIFSLLDDAVRVQLLSRFRSITLKQNEVLFHQSDPSDSVYLVVQGKLSAELTMTTGETKVVGHIDTAETVGELGALSNEPRSLTIKALIESTLLRLPASDFVALCHTYPKLMLESVQPIIARSKSLIQMLTTEKANKHIVIIAANDDTPLDGFSEKLLAYANHFKSLVAISDYQTDINSKEMDADILKERLYQMSHEKKSSHRILYILKNTSTPLAKIALKKADVLYIAVMPNKSHKIDAHILDKTHSRHAHLHSDPELIIIHRNNKSDPISSAVWHEQTTFSLQHHVRLSSSNDFHRLLRFVRGKAVGLVLSGGGTRGWAHLGAIKALLESKIPIDIIGGTSVGALVAACYAIDENYQHAYERFTRIVTASNRSISWRSLTWPVISLFNAQNFTTAQQQVFGDLRIEDLALPLFCVSCNMSTNNEETHKSGLIWEKTRASSSIPGLIPPMILNGEPHLDGGLLNNLPIDVMRQYIGTKGKIIAIDLNTFAPDRRKYSFPPILTFKDAIYSLLGIGNNIYRFPRFMDTFLRGLFIGSLAKSRHNSLSADICVTLNLSKFRLLYSNPKQTDRLVEIGYQETLLKCLYDHNRKAVPF